MTGSIRIGNPAIEVRLRRDPRARRMVLRVCQSGRAPTLTLPARVPLGQATAFLTDHEAWLRGHIGAAARLTVADGATFPIGGESVTIRVVPARRLRLVDGTLLVPGPGERAGAQVSAWLRERARAACAAGAGGYAARVGRSVGRITMRDPRSRWGSCTADGDLMFSWRLAMAPDSVLDYVVAHEVAHLVELNHSERFWAVVRRICPGFEAERDWLRLNGAGLHRIDFA